MKWISVKDRLPDYDDDVLIVGDGWDGMFWYVVANLENGKWYDHVGEPIQSKPTHWSILKEPPTK